jgi:acyl transferase domain-containing protein
VATVVIKRLDDAIAAGDPIRAVIRNTAINQDGKTAGITLPNQSAQESLIRSAYQNVGLDPRDTGYVEAHGTGTVAGDTIEIAAIASTFCSNGARDNELYVGSVKTNVGHLESASGLAGLIKAVLVIETGLIPPNINLETPKDGLNFEERKIKVRADNT